MSTPTRSPTPCASRSRACANGSANPGSSPQWPGSATASTPPPAPGTRGETVDRPPGLSVRLKLTLSYAGFLMLAGALLLAAVWVFLTRVTHVGLRVEPAYQYSVLRAFAPIAAFVLAFLLVFGLLGGWI